MKHLHSSFIQCAFASRPQFQQTARRLRLREGSQLSEAVVGLVPAFRVLIADEERLRIYKYARECVSAGANMLRPGSLRISIQDMRATIM